MPIGANINLEQQEELLKKVLERVKKLYTKGEKCLCAVVQKKPVINLLPHSIIVTNKRIIRHIPGILGIKFRDYLWKDLVNVHLDEGLFGGKLAFEFENCSFVIDKLPKNQAKRVYSIAQEREEEWVEKKRLRSMEEERAKSGATFINTNGKTEGSDIKSKLLEIKSLIDEDLITQDEYQRKKADILKQI